MHCCMQTLLNVGGMAVVDMSVGGDIFFFTSVGGKTVCSICIGEKIVRNSSVGEWTLCSIAFGGENVRHASVGGSADSIYVQGNASPRARAKGLSIVQILT